MVYTENCGNVKSDKTCHVFSPHFFFKYLLQTHVKYFVQTHALYVKKNRSA